MKKISAVLLVLLVSLHLQAQFEGLEFGTDSTLEVLTWNIENFPKNGQITIDNVVQIIKALDADVLAIQEITSEFWLNKLLADLDGWDGYYAYNQYAALAYVYKTEVIKDVNIFQIYKPYGREFPREPLVMEMNFMGEAFVIINNHLKCCGDTYLDMNDDWDEEKRRYDACVLLDSYINNYHPDTRVILLGDLNDILTDSPANNVFAAFTDAPEDYLFADMEIAQGDTADWSYPLWPSHIDHILITNEIFGEFANSGSDIQTLKVDEYFDGGFSEYDYKVSDHRPVGLKLRVNASLGTNEHAAATGLLKAFPNPATDKVGFTFEPVGPGSEIRIFNAQGMEVQRLELQQGTATAGWNSRGFPGGIYFTTIFDGKQSGKALRVVLLK